MSSEITVRDLMSRMGMASGSESFKPTNKNHSSNQPFISQHNIQKSIVYAAAESIRFTETMVASGESAGDVVSKVKEYVIKIWKKIVAFFKEIIAKIKGFLSKSKSSEDDFEKALDGISKVLSTPKKKGTAEDAKKVFKYRILPPRVGENIIFKSIDSIRTYGLIIQSRYTKVDFFGVDNDFLNKITYSKWKSDSYTIKNLKEDQQHDEVYKIKDLVFEDKEEKADKAHNDAEKMLKEYLGYKSTYKSQDDNFKTILSQLEETRKKIQAKIDKNDFSSVLEDQSNLDDKLIIKAANFIQQIIQEDIRKFNEKINEYNSALKISVSHIKEMAAIYLQTNYSSYEL